MKQIIAFIFFAIPLFSLAQQKELTKEEYIARVKANPDSISTLVDLRRVGGYDPDYEELQKLYNTLSSEVKSSKEGIDFQGYLTTLETVQIGKQAPEFEQNDTLGNPIKLSDFKGRYVLLEFWASWCPDCRRENPDLVHTYNTFKGAKFEILGISFDKDRNAWLKGIHDDKLSWPHVSDLKRWQNDVGTLYGVRSIPQNVLIDPTGKIIAKNLHGEALRKKLNEVLH